MIKCDNRRDFLGKTCRQFGRAWLEHWCEYCCFRWDHQRGLHKEDLREGCELCEAKKRRG